jgi:hypothetical protein
VTSSLFVKIRADANGQPYAPAGHICAVEGTAYPGAPFPPSMILDNGTGFWSGFSSALVGGVCNAADGLFSSTMIAYSALTIPMWKSVQEGRQKVVADLAMNAAAYHATHGSYDGLVNVLTGYSQGSMVTDQVWTLDILPPTGVLHYLLPTIYRIYQFGHIFRTPGIAHGNALAGLPESIIQDGVETGGIGLSMDLTADQTNYQAPDGRPVVHSCANKGDIYTCCSTGTDPWKHPAPEGQVGKIFEAIIMQPSLTTILSTAKVLGVPFQAIMEMFHAMKFFAAGPSSPHYQYFPQMVACINDCVALGKSLPHYPGY